MAVPTVNVRLPEREVFLRFPITWPEVRLIEAELPRVRTLELVVIFPLVSVSVPLTVTFPPREIPLDRLRVRLLRVTPGRVVLDPEPPTLIFDVAPPVRLPLDVETSPLMVKVFAPMDSAPLVSVSVPLTVVPEVRLTPKLLLMVKLFTVAGRPLPVFCAAVPL